MASQIVLSWQIDCSNTPLGPAAAATRLAAVVLYANDTTDPVLGQFFGLTVDSDAVTTPGSGIARRTLTLNLDGTQTPPAPPPFPCHPRAPTIPVLPYELLTTVPLVGDFTLATGSTVVQTTTSQLPEIAVGDKIEFLSQPGTAYQATAIGSTQISVTPAYTGQGVTTRAFKEIAAPATNIAVYSTSALDTSALTILDPPQAAGPGARGFELTYDDSEGNGPFTVNVSTTGKRPKAITLDPSSINVAKIIGMRVESAGAFGANVGELTLVEMLDEIPAIPNGTPVGSPDVWNQGRTYVGLTDEAQMLIGRSLAYMPPSYAAMAQQGASQLPTPAAPTNDQLSQPLAQFVQAVAATPPPATPFPPGTVPTPTFLSDYFTRRLQNALAGIPVVARQITFA